MVASAEEIITDTGYVLADVRSGENVTTLILGKILVRGVGEIRYHTATSNR